tara:strand:- start:1274 stop:2266 length:993 start_codon:yes stop_codon:yes gene_type:complete
MIILGIESSCDETGLALYDSNQGMLGHVVNSQHKIHGKYGGIVPELASRDHVLKLVPLLDELLRLAKKNLNDINLVTFTNGPGLLGPLLTGASFAKSLAWTLKIPSMEIDHLEAHIFSPMISENNLKPPFISLLVSGGHTILSSITDNSSYDILGKTLDDSAGEVFDKVARHLGLPYPGGPEISKASAKKKSSSFKFPRPMLNTSCYDFSFSGLKTHVTQLINETKLTDDLISDIAFDFENAILDVLITKTLRAAENLDIDNIVISGGVSANIRLRDRFDKEKGNKNIFFPDIAFSTDNGAMIAFMGWLKSSTPNQKSLEIKPSPSSSLV